MLDTNRSAELEFLLRTGSHIKIHQETQDDEPLNADFYTLRELVDEGVFTFLHMERGEGILLETRIDIKIAKPNTEFDCEHFEEGHVFKIEADDIVERDFLDLVRW